MHISRRLPGFFIASFFIFLWSPFAFGFQATVLPQTVKPGDPFFVKITENENTTIPEVIFRNKRLNGAECGKGCFVAIGAVDIATKPGTYVIKMKYGNKKKKTKIVVKKTKFPQLRLTLPKETVFLSTEDLKRVGDEDAKLKNIFTAVSNRQWEGGFIIPLENQISTEFGTSRILNKKKKSVHRGIDIKGRKGEEIKASNKGKIVLAEDLFYGGNTVIIDHGQGIYTFYMHLSKMEVGPDDIVSKGEVIGLVGSTGRSTGPHLHFGAKVMNISVNPVSLVELNLE